MNAFDSIFSNDYRSLRAYLEVNDVNVTNERGMSLLHYAIIFNNTEMFNLLLDNYINVNIQDNFGETPAHICVINNKLGFLKSLIRHKADLTIKNNDGQTPLYKACMLGRDQMVYLLLEAMNLNLYDSDKRGETVFMALVRSRNLELLNKLILDDRIVDMKNIHGEAPLHIAAKSGDIKVVEYLLKHKAFVNIKTKTLETPLFYAIRNNNLEIIDLLLAHGAILDCRSSFGDTAYNLVDSYDLQSYINEKSEKHKTYLYSQNYPLHYAIITENLRLCRAEAMVKNINRRDKYGYTPLDLAIKIGNEAIISLIKENL